MSDPALRMMPTWRFFSTALLLVLPMLNAGAERIMVRAVDQFSGTGIAGAQLVFPSLGAHGRSDASGWIQMDIQSDGTFESILSADGYQSRRFRLELDPGAPPFQQEFFLNPLIVNLEAFTVEGTLNDADRDALVRREGVVPTDQLSGEALKDVTDEGLGDTLEKLAGVNVESDGESVSGVNIRGAGPQQTRITLDGQSVAGGGGRGTTRGMRAMNQIPREFIDTIQVMKAPTPDMDADAIGGTVDLQTSRVALSKQTKSSLAVRSALQEEAETWGHRVNLAYAQPVPLGNGKSRLGILLAVNGERGENSPDILRVQNQWPERISPDTGEPVQFLAQFRMGSRTVSNEGLGLVLNTDLQLNEKNHFYLKGMWNGRESDQSIEFHTLHINQGEVANLLPDYGFFRNIRLEKQFLERSLEDESGSIVFGAEHLLGDWKIDESIGYSFANSKSIGGTNAIFQTQREFDASYDLSPDPSRPEIEILRNGIAASVEDLLDPAPYTFFRYDLIEDTADDSELALRLNLTRSHKSDSAEWIFKSGVKARIREAENDHEQVKYFPATDSFSLAEISAPGEKSLFRSRYPLGPSSSPRAMEQRFNNNPGAFRFDPKEKLLDSNAGDFTVSESIYAAYGMLQRESERWIIIAGLRLERTDSETKGFETISELDENKERIVEINPVSISGQYDMLLPGFHLLYRPTPNWIFRGSLTRTLQRPDFRDQSPSARVDLDRKRIRAGNPDLDPFDAKAIDLGTDFVLNEWGSMSLALFYKRIDDFIVDTEMESEYLDEPGFIISQAVNGSPADLYGLEASWSTFLSFLPDPFAGTELLANYVLTDSTAAYPEFPGETIRLPQQVKQTLNLVLRCRFQNWTVAWRARYRGEQLSNLIRPGQDQFFEGFWSHGLNVNYRLNDTVNISVGLANLNKPDRTSYQGSSMRMVSNVEGSRNYSIGINIKLGSDKLAAILAGR